MEAKAFEQVRSIYGRLRGIQASMQPFSMTQGTVDNYMNLVEKLGGLFDPENKADLDGLQLEQYEIEHSRDTGERYVKNNDLQPKLSQLIYLLEQKFSFNEKTTILGSLANEIKDSELKTRSLEILGSSSHFDIPVNQATLVLEDRIRKKSKDTSKKSGVELVNEVIKQDPSKTIIRVSDDPAIQEGFANMCRGIMLYFRNTTHHRITDMRKEDAMKVCAFIDLILQNLETAETRTQ